MASPPVPPAGTHRRAHWRDRLYEIIFESDTPAGQHGWHVRIGAPIGRGEFSQPEPDVSVVRASFRDYRDAHPTGAALVVEVAQTSLRLDHRIKPSIYAAGGIAEYWIVNLVAGVLEVHREPVAAMRRRWEYRSVTTLSREAHVRPLAAPDSTSRVEDLVPETWGGSALARTGGKA